MCEVQVRLIGLRYDTRQVQLLPTRNTPSNAKVCVCGDVGWRSGHSEVVEVRYWPDRMYWRAVARLLVVGKT